MASWFPSGVAAPASPPPRRGCNPSRFGASPNSSRACGPRSPRARSPHSKSAGAMARGACVPWASSGARAQAGWWGAVLGALCLLPVLLLLVRLGALPAARPASSAAQAAPDASSEHLLPLKEDAAAPHPAGVLTTPGPGPLLPQAPRRRRYTLTPARLRWDHFNLTYRILSFPRNLLSPSETRRGLAAAFRMWSDVSPFSFREVAPEQPSDLRIGFYPANHTDCLVSALHHCFDGPTGELAHAFFPPHGGIHFDDSEYWVLGPTRYSWKKGCLDRLFVCASWARRGFCDARRRLMKRLCPSSCDFCYEFPFPTVAATAPPPRTKTRLVSEGRNVTFRCGQKILHKKGKVHWYKDQEPLESSYPGYLALGEAHLSIIANAINEGTYTCVVRRRQRVLTTYSWRVRVRP
ncbi:matrix metalloproteinase-23 isoform X2 [Myotis myotis]|uniref:matrix metalloproteinase-23 isoform X2 n=1 Tax=Myotis myotis TaxID=51298 RepID=UPI00174A1424|nr:matrix metalloproteinase-23 isoform X2 [Myotis myotis]